MSKEPDTRAPNRVRVDEQLWPATSDGAPAETPTTGAAATGADGGFIFQEGGDWFGGDRYAIVKLLGRGGQCEVWLARDRDADPDDAARFVAIKVLQSRLQIDEKAGKRLKAEALAFLGIESKNLPRVYHADVDPERNLFFYVMEYLRGETLEQRIRRAGALDVLDALRIVAEAAEAVHIIHGLGILHCDLKPENIFLADDGRAVVLDLGVAKFDQDRFPNRSTFRTDQTSIAGTFAYMSPEQCLGDKLDVRSDVYALGIILYQCLTGFHPAQGHMGGWLPKDFRQWSGWHLNNQPKPLPLVAPWIPASVWESVSAAIRKDRDERQDSARLFAIELRARITVLRDMPLVGQASVVHGATAAFEDARGQSKALATTDQKGGVAIALATTDPMAAPCRPTAIASMAGASEAGGSAPVPSAPVPAIVAPRTPQGTEIIPTTDAMRSPAGAAGPRAAGGTEVIFMRASSSELRPEVAVPPSARPEAPARSSPRPEEILSRSAQAAPSNQTPGAQAVPIVAARAVGTSRLRLGRVLAFGFAGLAIGLGVAKVIAVLSRHSVGPAALATSVATMPPPSTAPMSAAPPSPPTGPLLEPMPAPAATGTTASAEAPAPTSAHGLALTEDASPSPLPPKPRPPVPRVQATAAPAPSSPPPRSDRIVD